MSVATLLQDGALQILERAFDTALRLDPQSRARLGALAGRQLAVELQGLGLTVYLFATTGGLRLSTRSEISPHATLKGAPFTLLRMVLAGERDQAPHPRPFPEGLEIAGDVETARRFQELLAGLDIDWEEQLARVIGDVAAHETARALRTLRDWCRRAAVDLEASTVEYLREEQALLPYRDEIEAFAAAVDTLRDDAERLEQRIRRLQQRAAHRLPSSRGEEA